MKKRLTQSYINSIRPPDKPYWITDDGCKNLRLYVGSKGKVWYVGYRDERGKYQNHKLGPAGEVLTVAVARDMANDFHGRLAKGEEPQKKQNSTKVLLGDYLENVYSSWVLANHSSGKKTMNMLRSAFDFLLRRPIDEITLMDMEKWRTARANAGVKAATLNRCTAGLKAAISWGVKNGLIENNPLQRLGRLKERDSDAKIRYLSDDERTRLMAALDAREEKMRRDRESHNQYLEERGRPLMPVLADTFTDHIKPMILLSLNTGIRRNNIFSLTWGDIDFDTQTMTLRAAVTKPGKTQHLPINSEALAVLSSWRDQCTDSSPEALVFSSPKTGGKFDNCNKAWGHLMQAAKIEKFRWHDMRHDFASQLVMAGVDLNTVRELMGHSSLAMTLRYAHLAPKGKLRAVELLVRK